MLLNGDLRRRSLADKLLFCSALQLPQLVMATASPFYYKMRVAFPLLLIFSRLWYFAHACALDSRYWCASYAAVVLVEHLVFRRGDFARYHVEDWDQPRKLPPGIAAIFSGALGMGIIVLCMDQVGIYCSLFFFPLIHLEDLMWEAERVVFRALLISPHLMFGGFPALQPE